MEEKKLRNFVKKHSDIINKPVKFRNRKKKQKLEGTEEWRDEIKPQHRPYHRPPSGDKLDDEY